MSLSWFTFGGSGSVTDPLNYNAAGVTPTCNQGITICAIFADVQYIGTPSIPRPYITGDLTAEIHAAVQNNQPSANVRLKP